MKSSQAETRRVLDSVVQVWLHLATAVVVASVLLWSFFLTVLLFVADVRGEPVDWGFLVAFAAYPVVISVWLGSCWWLYEDKHQCWAAVTASFLVGVVGGMAWLLWLR